MVQSVRGRMLATSMMGGLAIVGYREVLWLLPWVLGGAAVLLALRWELNLLLTGEELAASRGASPSTPPRRTSTVTGP